MGPWRGTGQRRPHVRRDIPRIAAVSIGWSDDVSAAREAIARALEDVGGEQSLILDRHVRGTPTNVSLPSSRRGWRS